MNWKARTELLLGVEKMERLQNAHVLIAGLGGVGAYAAELICRAGVGKMTLVDADVVQPSNINRQLPALSDTVGEYKTRLVGNRLKKINPELELVCHTLYLKDERITELLDEASYDFVVDAIDTISPKCFLIYHTLQRGYPIISSMGAGAKSDIAKVQQVSLWKTYQCGLSKVVRKRLKKMGVNQDVPVVFCSEPADERAVIFVENEENKKTTCGTVSYMPAVFGCFLAEYVIKRL